MGIVQQLRITLWVTKGSLHRYHPLILGRNGSMRYGGSRSSRQGTAPMPMPNTKSKALLDT